MSATKKCTKKTEQNATEHCEVADDSCVLQHLRKIDEKINEEWTKAIAEIKFNGSMMPHVKIVGVACGTNFNHSQPFNECVKKRIEDKIALAASDAGVKNGEIVGCWIASDANYETNVTNNMCHKNGNTTCWKQLKRL